MTLQALSIDQWQLPVIESLYPPPARSAESFDFGFSLSEFELWMSSLIGLLYRLGQEPGRESSARFASPLSD
jgi:hypothetical protein